MSRLSTSGNSLFSWLLLAPGMLFLAAFLVVPGILLIVLSLHDVDGMLMTLPTYSFSQYLHVFTSAGYARALGTTLWVAALTAVLCVLLAYPAAWLLVNTRSRTWRTVLYVILISPLLTSVVIRTFAWIVLLAQNGLINDVLRRFGLIDTPLTLLWNMKAVIVAYVQVMLPFAVLPLATSLGEIPAALPRASHSLGARPAYLLACGAAIDHSGHDERCHHRFRAGRRQLCDAAADRRTLATVAANRDLSAGLANCQSAAGGGAVIDLAGRDGGHRGADELCSKTLGAPRLWPLIAI